MNEKIKKLNKSLICLFGIFGLFITAIIMIVTMPFILFFSVLFEKKIKGCGTEVCCVETQTDGKQNDEPDIQVCGEYCPYHKKIHYCEKCDYGGIK